MADSTPRTTLRVILTAVVVPLLVLALGVWELQRGGDGQQQLEVNQDHVRRIVAGLEAKLAADPDRPMELQFRRNGQLFGGPYAVEKAREALDDAGTAVAISRWRRVLPPVTIACAGLTAALSALALVGAAWLAHAGRASRDALVRGFTVVHRLMPPLLGIQVLLLATCTVTVVAYEALALLEVGDFSTGSLKLLAVAAVLVGASLWTALKAVLQLRNAMALFTPDPMPLLGRPVTAEEAPGLWRMLDSLAARIGALRPDNVVVGIPGGFFVTSGPKLLQPGDAPLGGRTLFLPLPFLPLLQQDELAAIVGHELAHFSGSDTEYSLRFLPIYAGVERSLDAVALAGTTSAGSLSLLTRPSLRLGVFVMDRFHHTVRHWSRQREFAADAAGAQVTTTDAAARALLRIIAAERRIDETLQATFQAPDTAPADLVAAVAQAAGSGLDDPAPHLEERQPHPTDTHPPTTQRLSALGREPDGAAFAAAALPPGPDAMARLSDLFADPAALCRTATADFLNLARDHARAEHQALEDAAAAVDEGEQALVEDKRPAGIVMTATSAVFLLAALALLTFGMSGLAWTESRIVGGLAAFLGLGFGAWGLTLLRRRLAPFALLRPDSLVLPGLDRPIAWEHVADLDMVLDRGRINTRLLLPPEAPFPTRRPGARRIKLDAGKRIITFTAGLPRGMSPEGYADLFGRYRMADEARRMLAAETPPHPPE